MSIIVIFSFWQSVHLIPSWLLTETILRRFMFCGNRWAKLPQRGSPLNDGIISTNHHARQYKVLSDPKVTDCLTAVSSYGDGAVEINPAPVRIIIFRP
jgi:hypothetical protein